jgi:hypothetical protein
MSCLLALIWVQVTNAYVYISSRLNILSIAKETLTGQHVHVVRTAPNNCRQNCKYSHTIPSHSPMAFELISLTHSHTVHFIMDNAQLQQLLQVIRVGGGGHKTSKFSSAEGTEWRIWRRNFEQTLQINGSANERCQREAAAAMESTTAEFTSDIPPFVQGRLIQDMLNLYETRSLPDGGPDGWGTDRGLACTFKNNF